MNAHTVPIADVVAAMTDYGQSERPSGAPVHAQSKFAWDCTASVQLAVAEAKLWRASIHIWFDELRRARPKVVPGGVDGLTRCDRDLLWAIIWYSERYPEVFPSAEALSTKAKISVRQVHRSKAKLKSLKVLTWENRCDKTDKPGPKGFLVRQISNLYHLVVPPKLQAIMDREARRWRPRPDAGVVAEDQAIRDRRTAYDRDAIRMAGEERAAARHGANVVYAVSPAFNAKLDAKTRVTDRP